MPTIYQSLIALFFTVVGFLIGIYATNVYISRPVIQVYEDNQITLEALVAKTGIEYEKLLLQKIFDSNDEAISALQTTYTHEDLVHTDLVTLSKTIIERRQEEQSLIQALQREWFGIEVARIFEQKNSTTTRATSTLQQ